MPDAQHRVIVVDDDAPTRFMMSELCEAVGLEAVVLSSGEAFLEYIESQPNAADVILMDIHMPALSGADAVKKLRTYASHPPRQVPVIAVSADTTWRDEEKQNSHGIDAFLAKPLNPDKMLRMIEELAS